MGLKTESLIKEFFLLLAHNTEQEALLRTLEPGDRPTRPEESATKATWEWFPQPLKPLKP